MGPVGTVFEDDAGRRDRIAEAVGHDSLAEAVRSFAHAWDDTREEMTSSISGLGGAKTAIADTFEQADQELAAAMDGTSTVGASTPAGGGRRPEAAS